MPRRQPTTTAAPLAGASVRRRTAAVLLTLTAALVLAPDAATAPAGAGWRLPVDGPVAGGFRVTPGAPFAAGQRRGIDLRTRPGGAVRAACSGRVTYAGTVPGHGQGVTVRCGGLVATHLGLGATAVRRGRAVVRGARLGVAGRSGVVRLGARRTGDRHGYVDPLALLGAASGPAPLAPPPGIVGRRTRLPRPPAPKLRAPTASPRRAPTTPPAVWLGLALVAAAPGTIVLRRRRRAAIRTSRGRVPSTGG